MPRPWVLKTQPLPKIQNLTVPTYLGLDYGTKRIGLALADELGIALPLGTIPGVDFADWMGLTDPGRGPGVLPLGLEFWIAPYSVYCMQRCVCVTS